MVKENLFHISLIGGYNKQDVTARIKALEHEIESQKELHEEEKAGLQRKAAEKEKEAEQLKKEAEEKEKEWEAKAHEREKEREEKIQEKEEALEEQRKALEIEVQEQKKALEEQRKALEEQRKALEADVQEQKKELEVQTEKMEEQRKALEAEIKEQKDALNELEEKLAQSEKEYKRLDRKFQEAAASAEVIKSAFGSQVSGLVQRITEFSDDYKKTQIDFLEIYRYVLAMGERILSKEDVEKFGNSCFCSWESVSEPEIGMEYVKMKPQKTNGSVMDEQLKCN